MKNVLFVASDNSDCSGAFLSMATLARNLKRSYGYNILVVLPHRGNGESVLDAMGIKYTVIRSFCWVLDIDTKLSAKTRCIRLIKKALNWIANYRIQRLIRREKVDIVHINTVWTYVGAKAALHERVKLVWHIREFLEEDKKKKLWDRNGYQLMSKSDALVAISQTIYDKYSKLVGSDHMKIIYNGIDEAKYRLLNRHVFSQDAIECCIVGKIRPEKGQEQAIKAIEKMVRQGTYNVHLNIIGVSNDDYQEKLKKYVLDHSLSESITFCGYHEDTYNYYKRSDIVFMCSSAEAFGRVTVEAMFAGALVIGADSAATQELIEDGKTGYLYNCGDIDDLYNKICFAIENKEISRQIALHGQKRMLDTMTADKNAENVHYLYTSLA